MRYRKSNKKINIGCSPILWIIGVPTSIIGHEIHGSVFWSIVDLIFWPIAWIKWIVCKEVSISVIKSAFDFFLQ